MDPQKLTTYDEVIHEMQIHKDRIHRKLKHQQQVESAKKETAAAYREQLKEIKEEIQGELDIIDELETRRRELHTDEVLADAEEEAQG